MHSAKFLVLKTVVYSERHLLLSMLSQNGYLCSVLCVGGQGSSRKNTGKKLEIGYVIEVIHLDFKNYNQYISMKEFQVLWTPNKMRESYRNISLLQFFTEIATLVFQEKPIDKLEWEDIKSEHVISHEYSVLYRFFELLENWIFKNREEMNVVAALFLSKLVILQGVVPQVKNCHKCQALLSVENIGVFDSPYFYCKNCLKYVESGKFFWRFLVWASHVKQSNLDKDDFSKQQFLNINQLKYSIHELFNLLSLSKEKIKSLSILEE